MTSLVVFLVLAAVAAVFLFRASARRAALERRKREVAADLAAALAARGVGGLDAGSEAAVAEAVLAGADRDELFAAVADGLAQGFSAVRRKIDFKTEGPSILPRLVPTRLVRGLPGAASREVAGSDLSVIYLLAGEGGLRFLTAEALEASGVDEDAIWGVSEALLRQSFDGEEVRAAVNESRASGGAVEIRDESGLAASRLLQVHEHLEDGETVYAAVPGPDRLVLAAAPADVPSAAPFTSTFFRITADGLEAVVAEP